MIVVQDLPPNRHTPARLLVAVPDDEARVGFLDDPGGQRH
jgi:hypothetical protein